MKQLIVLIFCFLVHPLFSQSKSDPKISDSLWSLWKNENFHDTIRLQAIHKYTWDGYLFSAPDSAQYFAEMYYEFAKKKHIKKSEGYALNIIAVSHAIRRNFDEAEKLYLKSIEDFKEAKHLQGIANNYNNLGLLWKDKRNFEKSIDFYKKSLEIKKQYMSPVEIAHTISNIGALYADYGWYKDAEEYQFEALAIHEKYMNKDKGSMATCFDNLGNIYSAKGEYIRSKEYYEKALKLVLELNNSEASSAGLMYNSLGILHKNFGAYSEAFVSYRKSLQINRESKNKTGIAFTYLNIGNVYSKMGHKYTDSVIYYYTESLEMLKEVKHKRGEFVSLVNLASMYLGTPETYSIADSLLAAALSLSSKMNYNSGLSGSLIALSRLNFNKDNFEKSLFYADSALHVAKSRNKFDDIIDAKRIKFNALIGLNKFSDAEIILEEILEKRKEELSGNFPYLTEIKKVTYFKSIKEDFDLQLRLLFEQTKIGQNNIELCKNTYSNLTFIKGLSLRSMNLMKHEIEESNDTLLIAKYAHWKELKQKVSAYEANGMKSDLLKKEVNQMEEYISKKSNSFIEYEKLFNTSWKEIQSELAKDEVIVEYVRFSIPKKEGRPELDEVHYAAFVISKNSESPKFYYLFSENEIVSYSRYFLNNDRVSVDKIYGTNSSPNTKLFEFLIEPLKSELSGMKNVYIIPEGILNKFSFSSIWGQGKYLSQKYNLTSLLSSSELLKKNTTSISQNENLLAFGGISYTVDQDDTKRYWKELSGTLEEVNQIQSIISKSIPTEIKTEERASEKELRNSIKNYSMFHLATHGFFYKKKQEYLDQFQNSTVRIENVDFRGENKQREASYFSSSQNPLDRSGVVLSGCNHFEKSKNQNNDGILTANELSQIDLRKLKLVVLSACETGLGDVIGSEGVYGLERALKMAGVKNMIIALWKVPDKETSEFMTIFYARLIKVKDISKAFNYAQNKMRAKYDPYFWGAFVLKR